MSNDKRQDAEIEFDCNDKEYKIRTNEVEIEELSQVTLNISEPNTQYEIISNTTTSTNKGGVTPQGYHHIIVYSICLLSCIILINIRAIMHFKFCMNSSKALHRKIFACVLQAPIRFFDKNPSGRILNRFSKDFGDVDEQLPTTIFETVQAFLGMLGVLMMVFIVSPLMTIPAVLVGIFFFYLIQFFLRSAHVIKRFEGIVKGPVFSHTAASLRGLPIIRSSNLQSKMIKEFDCLQDQHTSSGFMLMALSQVFGYYLEFILGFFIAIVTFHFLFYHGQAGAGNVGLVLSQCLTMAGMLQYGIRQTAEVASNMVSVERILQYTKLEKETDNEIKSIVGNWPRYGKIVFRNMTLRYSPEDAPVLKNLNVQIQPQQKVGIVGRTGAGKSSMIASLFRLAPIEGEIYIDGVDTSRLDLSTLRSNISIIPQEPVLFSGTVRYNLDPFGSKGDETLWKALEDVELKNVIKDLNQEITEGGSNFSVGQRQLICLARAIVRNNKMLVMDEATANVDHCTDSFIQKTIKENFKYCTVLTIAHRINTIMDSDKVLVMDAGQAVEFDHPHMLLQNPHGYLTKMLRESGPHMEAVLRTVAEEDFDNRFETYQF